MTPTSSPHALILDQLCKNFGRPAVDHLNLTVKRGELYALLGPNGAGKTTTLRMVAGLMQPDSGSIQVLGIDLAQDASAAKQKLAYLPDDALLYNRLMPFEYLEFVAGLWGIMPSVPAAKRKNYWIGLISPNTPTN